MCKKIFKYHLVMSKTIALIRHPSLLFSLYPEVKNHRSYSAPSLLFFCSQNVLHRSYSARFYISFIWHSGVSEMVDHLNSLFAPPFKVKYNLRKVIFPKCFKNVITLLNDIKEIMKK